MTVLTLREDQKHVKNLINVAWTVGGHRNVLAVAATGWGKTVLLSEVVADERGAVCVIAHRHELVGQISMALARNGIRHRIIGSKESRSDCRAAHIEEFGYHYIDDHSQVAVASVDTLKGMDPTDPWFARVALIVMDEAHHVLKHNKWGKAVMMFPNARMLGVTAETERADFYGLGRMNDGWFDALVEAPSMRAVINMGNLTDYRVFIAPTDIDFSQVNVGPSGELVQAQNAKVTKESSITGDVVKHYMKHAMGKLGIVFSVDVEAAEAQAKGFRDMGIPAESIDAKTKSTVRRDILRRFRKREILVLVNVDLFGEGFDLPAIEVVMMARRTESFNLYKQQFGRALRLLAGKTWAIIIDHVGNFLRHGPPDQVRVFTLGKPVPKAQRAPDENLVPMRACVECSQPYERTYPACPHCGTAPELPGERKGPEYVDGDLIEVHPEWLARMRGEADAVVNTNFIPIPQGVPDYVAAGIKKKALARAVAQGELREVLKLWAGWRKHLGQGDQQIYRLFYLTYGMDMLTAQTLGATDATALREKLSNRLLSNGVVKSVATD